MFFPGFEIRATGPRKLNIPKLDGAGDKCKYSPLPGQAVVSESPLRIDMSGERTSASAIALRSPDAFVRPLTDKITELAYSVDL